MADVHEMLESTYKSKFLRLTHDLNATLVR